MLKLASLILLSCALLLAGDKKGSSDDARQKCLDGCAKRLDTCKKNAKTDKALTACTQSNNTCRAACNK
jgi:hypothetical protein